MRAAPSSAPHEFRRLGMKHSRRDIRYSRRAAISRIGRYAGAAAAFANGVRGPSARAAGTPVLGICGGYQMLGAWIHDPDHVESRTTSVRGLALLPTVTTFATTKTTRQVEGTMLAPPGLLAPCAHAPITGYEIHAGTTRPATLAELPVGVTPLPTTPAIRITRRASTPTDDVDGTVDAEGLTWGTYVHGLLESTPLRRSLLAALRAARGTGRATPSDAAHAYSLDAELDRLAAHVRAHVDWPAIEALVHAQR